MKAQQNVLELIGNTPMVQVNNLDTGLCQLFLKLESFNPGGSLKDRSALYMINGAEKEGKIKPGWTLVEATSGNTALGLAQVANLRGYKLLIVSTDKMSQEKLAHIKATGAEVVLTRCDYTRDHPDYYHNLARRLATERKDHFYIEQFANPANPLAHERTTGPEIWEQMGHRLDAVVCGVGTGGHFTGIGRFMKKVAPQVKMILADPEGSILAPYFRTGKIGVKSKFLVEGIGEDAIHGTYDDKLVRAAYTITDAESFATARELLRKESIFAGPSTGTAVSASLRYCREQKEPQRVVTFVYDSGAKYLSKLYNDEWMKANGFGV
jgi:cystathionine beta-synthase